MMGLKEQASYLETFDILEEYKRSQTPYFTSYYP